MESAPTTTDTTSSVPGSGTGIATTTATPATPAPAPTPAPSWSLDTWKSDDWDGLPEQIRRAAEARYSPQLQERDQRLAQVQRDLEDTRARWLKGSPFAAEDKAALERKLGDLQREYDSYKGQWSEQTVQQQLAAHQKRFDENIQNAANVYDQRLDAEVEVLFPWAIESTKENPNPAFDPAKYMVAEELFSKFNDIGVVEGLPTALFLRLAELSEPQRNAFINSFAEGNTWRAALQAASRPPAHQPSAAARAAAAGAGDPPAPPRRAGARTRPSTLASAEFALKSLQRGNAPLV